MSASTTERWFYLDGFDASEFCPLWRYTDRFGVILHGRANWCRVHYEHGDGQPTIEAPMGNYHHFALDRVNVAIE